MRRRTDPAAQLRRWATCWAASAPAAAVDAPLRLSRSQRPTTPPSGWRSKAVQSPCTPRATTAPGATPTPGSAASTRPRSARRCRRSQSFAVNVDTRESDLAAVDVEELTEQRLAGDPLPVSNDVAADRRPGGRPDRSARGGCRVAAVVRGFGPVVQGNFSGLAIRTSRHMSGTLPTWLERWLGLGRAGRGYGLAARSPLALAALGDVAAGRGGACSSWRRSTSAKAARPAAATAPCWPPCGWPWSPWRADDRPVSTLPAADRPALRGRAGRRLAEHDHGRPLSTEGCARPCTSALAPASTLRPTASELSRWNLAARCSTEHDGALLAEIAREPQAPLLLPHRAEGASRRADVAGIVAELARGRADGRQHAAGGRRPRRAGRPPRHHAGRHRAR